MIALHKVIWIALVILWIIKESGALLPEPRGNNRLTYTWEKLLQLGSSMVCRIKPSIVLPAEIRPRKRGRRGGVRTRLRRRPFKPPLPSIILSNVRSLRNKMDLLHAKCLVERAYKEACIIAFTETWLNEAVTDAEVDLDNFTILRADRTRGSRKVKGGGVCMYVNNNNIKIHSKVCTPNLEMLTVSLRPFHLPREFPTVVISCVYIPPSANINAAAELVANSANDMQGKYPEAPVFIVGDFNSCRLESVLPSFQQYVDVPTRRGNILDLCYGNITDAYISQARPPLGFSDHNVVFLLPHYKPVLKRHKPQNCSINQWSEGAITQLQGSLACTDWDIFDGNLDERVSVITDYIKFCISTTIPVKTFKKYPNSKPWITHHINHRLKEKQEAFQQQDWVSLKIISRQVKNDIIMAKLKYKEKLEQEFSTMNTKEAFQKVRTLTGYDPKPKLAAITDPAKFAEDLNTFYTRFDTINCSEECKELLETLPIPEPAHPAPFTVEDVRRQLSRCKPGKSPGPDGIQARVFKECATELSPIMHAIFWESYRTASVPTLWKTSTVIPVPKKPRPSELNHYRPVALTSIAMKCLERLVLNIMLPVVGPQLDANQFAYKAKRGTEDAVACLLHPLLQHLESSSNFARLLFIDFSSAFNTIQRHQMIRKLHHLNVPPLLIHWVHSFLSDRPQTVRVGNVTSSTTITNTGAPQGCVLSPFLFTLYTNDCVSPSPITTYFKYSDDTAILALLNDNNSVLGYLESISHFIQWCNNNYLELNVAKTKELVITRSTHSTAGTSTHDPIHINNKAVEMVEHHKHLGLTIDNKLSFGLHTMDIYKRGQQRLCAIRKLRALSVAPHLLLLLYQSILQPILLYCSPCFYNMLTVSNRNKLIRITHRASKIIGLPTPNLSDLNNRAIARKASIIAHDPSHPLNPYFTLLPSGRRYRTLIWKRARFDRSFVPSAISSLNKAPR